MNRRRFIALTGGGIGTAGVGPATVAAQEDPALFEVANAWTNSPVHGGEVLEVTAVVENVGGETGTTDVELVVGYSPAVEDSRTLTLAPGESRQLTLEFEAGQPSGGREEFPVRVDTGAHTVTEMVVVEAAEPALFEVASMATNSPVGPGELLYVDATIENVGDETGTTDVELIVGHDPQVEDSRMLTLDPGETVSITLEFEAGQPSGGREEFPVRVDTGAHERSESVVVTADGGDGGGGVTFDSCTQARLSGTFEDGDPCYASTIFYTESGVGDTLIEDGLTVGDDVDAPFSGTIVVRISDDSRVIEDGDRIYVDVPDYGEYGTVLTGLTTDPEDYQVAGITHSNPRSEDCLEEIRSEWEDATGGGGSDPALFEVASVATNSPVGPNELLSVDATIENVGDEAGTTDVELIVGYSPAVEDSRTLTLGPGESADITLEFRAGEPTGGREEFPVQVDTGAHAVTEMVVVTEG